MKITNYIAAIAFCLISFASFAQYTPDKKEAIETMKISFITKRLNLTPEEAKVFWPVYNQYESELETLRNNHRKEMEAAKEDFSNLTDKNIEKMVDSQIAFKQSEIDIMKKYHIKFKQVLPVKKVAMLYRAEEDFKRMLLKKIQGR